VPEIQSRKKFDDILMHVKDVLGDKSTTNVTLEHFGKQHFPTRFIGVFSSDQIPVGIPNGKMFIVNTDIASQRGTHWIAVIKKNNITYAFDSFGRKVQQLSRYFPDSWVNVNHRRLESYKEEDCGQMSMAFLICADKHGVSFVKYLN
jgi:hypothetical protein